ncbi:MAG TPA: PEP-utilizing enzyme [Pseudonocardia sp.]|uniref:PEP-utilizing enzyme n=1 Tax=Pseudonocardia sp. TaxID=60912 RepID=UPI002B4AD446|nr:PEP-utilizing enzyme [Pseudonocardia sp.]HLU55209.1 PEP-utilizing enzyme [Pseudonocardia sp.]
MCDETFEPPDDGTWELDTTHLARPVSWFLRSPLVAGAPRGFEAGLARYGLLLGRHEIAVIGGFMYAQRVPFGAGGTATPEQMRDRIETSARAFRERFWREDLAHWDEVVKPGAVAAHLALQEVDPATLFDDELADHVGRCRDHLEAMFELHHRYSAPSVMVTGDFLAGALEWTGVGAGELMGLLRGTSPVSTGFAVAELDALADAVAGSHSARAALAVPGEPEGVLRALTADPCAGPAARRYLDAVRYRSIGYDVSEPTADELPSALVGAIRAAVAHRKDGPGDDGDAALSAISARVPAEHLAEFDDRLHEARPANRLCDERATYSDGWAAGFARRAVLEAGRRLAGRGALADPEHAVDADAAELAALLRGESGPSAQEVAERFQRRTTLTVDDAPPIVGPPPAPPPPLEAIPEPARRATLAVNTAMSNLFDVPDTANDATVLRGLAVNSGVYEGPGPARLVADGADFDRIRPGDVLVTRVTTPYFTVVLPSVGAIVTDRGGQPSHAAIVAREYGIPGVVGTRAATRVIPDGAIVRVDGTTGEVRVLG